MSDARIVTSKTLNEVTFQYPVTPVDDGDLGESTSIDVYRLIDVGAEPTDAYFSCG